MIPPRYQLIRTPTKGAGVICAFLCAFSYRAALFRTLFIRTTIGMKIEGGVAVPKSLSRLAFRAFFTRSSCYVDTMCDMCSCCLLTPSYLRYIHILPCRYSRCLCLPVVSIFLVAGCSTVVGCSNRYRYRRS